MQRLSAMPVPLPWVLPLLVLFCAVVGGLWCMSPPGVAISMAARPLPASSFAPQATAPLQPLARAIRRPHTGLQGTKRRASAGTVPGPTLAHRRDTGYPTAAPLLSAWPPTTAQMAVLWGVLGAAAMSGAVALANQRRGGAAGSARWVMAAAGSEALHCITTACGGGPTALRGTVQRGSGRWSGCLRASKAECHEKAEEAEEEEAEQQQQEDEEEFTRRADMQDVHYVHGLIEFGVFVHSLCNTKDGNVREHHAMVLPPHPRPPVEMQESIDDDFPDAMKPMLKAIGPPFQKASTTQKPQKRARGFGGSRAPPPALAAPRGWSTEDRRTWADAMKSVCEVAGIRRTMYFGAKSDEALRHVHVVLPQVLAQEAEFMDLRANMFMHDSILPEQPAADTWEHEWRLQTLLIDGGFQSALRRYTRVATRRRPSGSEHLVPQGWPGMSWHAPSALAGAPNMSGAVVLFVALLEPTGAVLDPEEFTQQLTAVMHASEDCSSLVVVGTPLPGDGFPGEEEADKMLHDVIERVRIAYVAELEARAPADFFLRAAEALERDEGWKTADQLTASAESLRETPLSPEVSAALRRFDAAVALSMVVKQAADSGDVVAWREALPRWESVQQEARDAGCSEGCALSALVAEAVAGAREAVGLEDRLVAAVRAVPPEATGIATAEQLQGLRRALAAAEAAPAPVAAALASRVATATEAADAAEQQAAKRAEVEAMARRAAEQAAHRLSAAAEALEHGGTGADAARAARTSGLASLSGTPPPPAVSAALRRLDAALALAAAADEAAACADAAALREALPSWERVQREARAAGCAPTAALWARVADAAARATAAADIEDRLAAALSAVPPQSPGAVTPEQLRALREALAAASEAAMPRSATLDAAQATAERWGAVLELRAAGNDVARLGAAIAAAQAAGLEPAQLAAVLQAAPEAGLPWQPQEPGDWKAAGEKMVWDNAAELGAGSVGTVVFKGEFQAPGRGPPLPAAVKRLRRDRGPFGEEQLSLVKREVGIVYRLQSKVSPRGYRTAPLPSAHTAQGGRPCKNWQNA